jgi:hypothetical protein
MTIDAASVRRRKNAAAASPDPPPTDAARLGGRQNGGIPRDLARADHGLRSGLELDQLRTGKRDAHHLGSEIHEHCRVAVLGADHGTEAVPIMADSIAHGEPRHSNDGWRRVEGASRERPGWARCREISCL